jgi:hypothetical protein
MYINTVRIYKNRKKRKTAVIYITGFFLKNQLLIALIISIYIDDIINCVNYISI